MGEVARTRVAGAGVRPSADGLDVAAVAVARDLVHLRVEHPGLDVVGRLCEGEAGIHQVEAGAVFRPDPVAVDFAEFRVEADVAVGLDDGVGAERLPGETRIGAIVPAADRVQQQGVEEPDLEPGIVVRRPRAEGRQQGGPHRPDIDGGVPRLEGVVGHGDQHVAEVERVLLKEADQVGAAHRRVGHGQHPERDLMTAQDLDAAHHPVEGAPAVAEHADLVVLLARSVDRDPDRDGVPQEKLRPGVVDEGAVGLQPVGDLRVAEVVGLHVEEGLEPLAAEREGLASVPDQADPIDLAVDMGGVGRIQTGHQVFAEARSVVFSILVDVIAVGAAEVARPRRLQDQSAHKHSAPR